MLKHRRVSTPSSSSLALPPILVDVLLTGGYDDDEFALQLGGLEVWTDEELENYLTKVALQTARDVALRVSARLPSPRLKLPDGAA
jgi:hypothetical protein